VTTELPMPYGFQHGISRPIGDVRVNVVPGPEIELVASILPDPNEQNPLNLPATTVAMHMDRAVARILYLRLRDTFRSMDWPLPP